MMMTWRTDTDAERLLPGKGRGGFFVVLFVKERDGMDELIKRFSQLTTPPEAKPVVVDVEGAVHTARWFGISETPALAAISNGCLLAIDHGCDARVCSQLIDFATQQRDLLEAADAAALGLGSYQ